MKNLILFLLLFTAATMTAQTNIVLQPNGTYWQIDTLSANTWRVTVLEDNISVRNAYAKRAVNAQQRLVNAWRNAFTAQQDLRAATSTPFYTLPNHNAAMTAIHDTTHVGNFWLNIAGSPRLSVNWLDRTLPNDNLVRLTEGNVAIGRIVPSIDPTQMQIIFLDVAQAPAQVRNQRVNFLRVGGVWWNVIQPTGNANATRVWFTQR